MRWLVVALTLALAPLPASAFWQSRDSNYGKNVVAAGGGYTGPGDVLSGALGFWSCQRAYNAAYATGANKGCNIRRASDNETCDFLIAASGSIGNSAACSGADNGQSLATFLTSTSGFVTKAYDQSGHGYDVVQATAAYQPQITLGAIGGLPAMTGANSQFLQATVTAISDPVYITATAVRTAGFTFSQAIFSSYVSGNNVEASFDTVANQIRVYGGTSLPAAAADSTSHALQFLANSTSSVLNVDGTETTGDSGIGGTSTTFTVAARSAAGVPLQGYLGEAGVWNTAPAAGVRTSLCHNMRLYWGTGGSC